MSKTENLLIKTKKNTIIIIVASAIFAVVYSILRYNIFGQVPWKDLPFYVMNKALSLTVIVLFSVSSSYKFFNRNKEQLKQKHEILVNTIEPISFLLIIIHVFMSLMLFKPEVFAKFFVENGTISLVGGISMLAGIISFVLLFMNKLNSFLNKKNNATCYFFPVAFNIIIVFIILHISFMGFNGWLTPKKWHGGMPPISLLAIAFLFLGLIIKILNNNKKRIWHFS